MVLIRGNLIIPKIWCYFYVNVPFIELFCLKDQAFVPVIPVGKLSNILYDVDFTLLYVMLKVEALNFM